MDPQILNVLAQLGPWGLAVAALYLWWRSRNPAPPAPTPSPTPGPEPVPTPSQTPILDALLELLRKKLLRQATTPTFEAKSATEAKPTPADIDEDTATELLKLIQGNGSK